MCDEVAFESSGVVEVELLQRLAGRESRRSYAGFAAMGLAGGDFALQPRDEEFLMRPGLGPGAFGEAIDGLTQRRCFQRSGEKRDLC